MKFIYLGSPEFSVFGLKALLEAGHECVAVVSRPDKIRGRKKQEVPTVLKAYGLEKGLKVYSPDNVNDEEFLNELDSLKADVIIVSAFGQILKSRILQLCPYGALNIHGSLLPYYRGASPINAVLRDGLEVTGVTIIYMDEGMDEGDILIKGELPIAENICFDELRDNMGKLGGELITESLARLEQGTAPRIKQEGNAATYCSLLTREDELIDWKQQGKTIHNQIRSLSPDPGAYTILEDKPFKIITAVFEPGEGSDTPGKVTGCHKKLGVSVSVSDGTLWLKTVRPQGKKTMRAQDWYNGLRNEVHF